MSVLKYSTVLFDPWPRDSICHFTNIFVKQVNQQAESFSKWVPKSWQMSHSLPSFDLPHWVFAGNRVSYKTLIWYQAKSQRKVWEQNRGQGRSRWQTLVHSQRHAKPWPSEKSSLGRSRPHFLSLIGLDYWCPPNRIWRWDWVTHSKDGKTAFWHTLCYLTLTPKRKHAASLSLIL